MSDKLNKDEIDKTTSKNIKEELNRRNIKFLNVSVDLVNDNKPQLTIKNLNNAYIENVELVGSGFEYKPFAERCESKFEDIKLNKTLTKKPEATEAIKEDTDKDKWGKGEWDKEKKTLTLDRSFTRPGIYTGVIRVKKEYEKNPENYIVSFKKQPSDYIGYRSLKITAGKLIIEDLYVTDGYKCIRYDCLDQVTISYNNKEIKLKQGEKKDCKNSQPERKYKVITVNLLELVDYGRLEADKKITLTAEYFDKCKISTDIFLVDQQISIEGKNIFATNQGYNTLVSNIKEVFGISNTSNVSFPSTIGSTLNSTIKLGSYSIAKFEQTYGSSSSILGGAKLNFYPSAISTTNILNISVSSGDNLKIGNSSSYFVYTHQLSGYSMKSWRCDTKGDTGLIGDYYFKVDNKTVYEWFSSKADY